MAGMGRCRTGLAVGLTAAALLAAGCGDDEKSDSGGSADPGLAEAKTALIDQCHSGHESDAEDLKLCQCAADNLEEKHDYDEQKFRDAVETAKTGKLPPEVVQAIQDC